jgi:hypothetical protein
MRSPWKQIVLGTVFGLLALAPAFAGGPSSSPAVDRVDAFFASLQSPAMTKTLCTDGKTLPDDLCTHINGVACAPEGTHISCRLSSGLFSTCICQESCHWACIF